MTTRVPVQHYDLPTPNSFIGTALHDLNTSHGSPSDVEAISDVDRDAVTDDRLDDDQDSTAVVSLTYISFDFCSKIQWVRFPLHES